MPVYFSVAYGNICTISKYLPKRLVKRRSIMPLSQLIYWKASNKEGKIEADGIISTKYIDAEKGATGRFSLIHRLFIADSDFASIH